MYKSTTSLISEALFFSLSTSSGGGTSVLSGGCAEPPVLVSLADRLDEVVVYCITHRNLRTSFALKPWSSGVVQLPVTNEG